MICVLKYHFAIFVFIFNVCTLCQVTVSHHQENGEDRVRLSPEEILRRRKLVESYLSELDEKQKDWLETNHMVLPKSIRKDANNLKDSQLIEKTNANDNVQSPPKLKTPENDLSDAAKSIDDPDSITLNEKWENFKRDYLDPKYSSKSQINETEFEIRRAIFWSFYPEIENLEKDSAAVKDPRPGKTFSAEFEAKFEKKLLNSQNAVSSDKKNTKDKGSTDYYVSREDFCSRRNLSFYLTKTCDSKEGVKAEQLIPQTNEQKTSVNIFADRKGKLSSDELTPNFSKGTIVHKSKSSEFISSENHKENSMISGKDAKTDASFTKDVVTNHQQRELISETSDNSNKVSANGNSIHFSSSREISTVVNENSLDSELIKRQNIYNSYQSQLMKKQENYIETNQFSYSNSFMSKSELSSFYDENSHNLYNYHKDYSNLQCSQEKQYFIRWVKILLNKYSDYLLNEDSAISFSFSSNSLNKLKSLASEHFDITVLDEIISDLISNATLTNGYQLSYTFMNFMPSTFTILYILGACLCLIILFHYFKYLCLILVFLSLSIVLNGFKLYQKKVAEKHATLSSIEPSYCQSILSHESGIWAQFKEYVRQYAYSDKCERYYSALMIDPLSEISIPVIIADLASSTFYHMFQPLGRLFNTIFKDLTHNLGYFDYFFLLLALIVVLSFLVICVLSSLKYRLVFPFFMGSLEPSARVGSRVEDLKLEEEAENSQKSLASSNLPQLNYTTVIHLADVYKDSYVCKENDLKTAAVWKPFNPKKPNFSKMLARRLSF